MQPEAWGALGALAGALAGVVGAWLTLRGKLADARVARESAADTAQDKLIDQLQEELGRYRQENDKRVERLEATVERLDAENRGYRTFIGIQRDHMAAHGVPLPPWPPDLPR